MTTTSDNSSIQPLSLGMRALGIIGIVLVFIAGVQLFVLADYTDRYFAWTIQPPLTAAFIGAFYWGTFGIIYFGGRGGAWARVRPGMPAVVVFSTLVLIATLLHLDRFHLGSPDPFILIVTWVWIVVYIVVPPALVVLWILQLRVPGRDPAPIAALPGWYRGIVGVVSVVALVIGVGLFIVPQATAQFWPWMLTPLTAQVVSSWLLLLALLLGFAIRENDWDLFRPTAITCTVLGVLQIVALGRYLGEVEWRGISTWIYLLFVLVVLAIGLYGWWEAGRSKRPHA